VGFGFAQAAGFGRSTAIVPVHREKTGCFSSTARNAASHAGWAGHAGAVTAVIGQPDRRDARPLAGQADLRPHAG
jgi:hypothetical protein